MEDHIFELQRNKLIIDNFHWPCEWKWWPIILSGKTHNATMNITTSSFNKHSTPLNKHYIHWQKICVFHWNLWILSSWDDVIIWKVSTVNVRCPVWINSQLTEIWFTWAEVSPSSSSVALCTFLAWLKVTMVTVSEGLESFMTFIVSSLLLCFLWAEPGLGLLNSFFTEEINPCCKKTWENTSVNWVSEDSFVLGQLW